MPSGKLLVLSNLETSTYWWISWLSTI